MRATLRAALLIGGNDLRRRLRNRSFLVQAVIGPVILAALISAAFSGGFGFDIRLGVVDDDRSELATQIVSGLLEGEAGDVEFERYDDRPAAEEAMDDSDVGAVVVLPEGFAASLATDEPLPVEVLVDSGATVPGVVARAVAAGIGARLDAVRLAVVSAAALGAAPLDADELAGLEPAVSLDRRETGEISPAATVAPGMGLLFLYFTVGGVARGLLEEGRTRLLDRVRAAPATLAAVLYGKGIAVVALGLVSLASLWGASTVLLGADWGDPAGVALVVVAATLAVDGIASVIAGTASNEQSADLTATFVAFVLGILGGSLVPLSELPDAMTRLARFTPNGWAQEAFAELSAGGAGVVDVLPEVAVLLAWAVVTAALGLALLPRRLGAR